MKKLLTAFVAVLYLGLSSGFAINIHYCMGKIISAKIDIEKSEKCGKCGMANKSGCCQDELTIVKISDSHQANYSSYNFHQFYFLLSKNFGEINGISQPDISQSIPVLSSSPPENTFPSLYLLYNVFRI